MRTRNTSHSQYSVNNNVLSHLSERFLYFSLFYWPEMVLVLIIAFIVLKTLFWLSSIWISTFLTCTSIGYRPNYQCSSSSTYENQTYSSNNSYFVTYYKCHIKVFYNDTTRDAPQLVKDDLCTEGYQYSLDKYSTFVTEVCHQISVLVMFCHILFFIKIDN